MRTWTKFYLHLHDPHTCMDRRRGWRTARKWHPRDRRSRLERGCSKSGQEKMNGVCSMLCIVLAILKSPYSELSLLITYVLVSYGLRKEDVRLMYLAPHEWVSSCERCAWDEAMSLILRFDLTLKNWTMCTAQILSRVPGNAHPSKDRFSRRQVLDCFYGIWNGGQPFSCGVNTQWVCRYFP